VAPTSGPETTPPPAPEPDLPRTTLRDHTVLVGYGRVGSLVGQALKEQGMPFLVIEERPEVVERLRAEGIEAILGQAGQRGLLEAVNLAGAFCLISAIPNPFEASYLIETARAANPDLRIIARAHSEAEIEHLYKYGASLVIMGELEIARGMIAGLLGPRLVVDTGSPISDETFRKTPSEPPRDAFEASKAPPGDANEESREDNRDVGDPSLPPYPGPDASR
jgi:CPA2 family monovalent cation:H+ antiporter-2